MRPEPTCCECGKKASQTGEYTPEDPVENDGTYNEESNRFCCTTCYIAIGMPASPTGWKAP